MKGLLIKDILNLRKYGRTLAILAVFYGLFGLTTDNSSLFLGMITVMSAMTAVTSFAYDDQAKWDTYALSLPVTRRDMVRSKYTLALLLSLAGGVAALLVGLLTALIRRSSDLTELLAVNYVMFGIALFFVAVLLPLVYKFGTEKSRLLIFAIFAVPALAPLLLGRMGISLPQVSEQTVQLLIWLSVPAALFLFWVSYRISYAVYRKKEV